MTIIIKTKRYANIFGTLDFCNLARTGERIEAINIDKKSITTTWLAIFKPPMMITNAER